MLQFMKMLAITERKTCKENLKSGLILSGIDPLHAHNMAFAFISSNCKNLLDFFIVFCQGDEVWEKAFINFVEKTGK